MGSIKFSRSSNLLTVNWASFAFDLGRPVRVLVRRSVFGRWSFLSRFLYPLAFICFFYVCVFSILYVIKYIKHADIENTEKTLNYKKRSVIRKPNQKTNAMRFL